MQMIGYKSPLRGFFDYENYLFMREFFTKIEKLQSKIL